MHTDESFRRNSVQVNLPAESGEMGVLANHVPSIEQLKPGLVEVMEEGGASKKFFRMSDIQVFDLGCDKMDSNAPRPGP